MTPEQINDLLIEWSIYSKDQQQLIRDEYTSVFGHNNDNETEWLNFLKEKLEIEEYWKKTGLK